MRIADEDPRFSSDYYGSDLGGGAGRESEIDPDEMRDDYVRGRRGTFLGFAQGRREAGVAGPQAPETVVRLKCRSCGYLDSEDATFCSKCGERLETRARLANPEKLTLI